jgi:hypothetical protein
VRVALDGVPAAIVTRKWLLRRARGAHGPKSRALDGLDWSLTGDRSPADFATFP